MAGHRPRALALCTFLVLAAGVGAQSSDQIYIYMDLYVGRDGSVLVYGETNLQDAFLNLGATSLPISGGRFSNATDELTSKAGSSWNLSLDLEQDFGWGEIAVYLPSGAAIVGSPRPSDSSIISEEKGGLVVRFYDFAPARSLQVSYELGPPAFSVDLRDYVVPILLVAVVLMVAAAFIRYFLPRLRPGEAPATTSVDHGKWDAISPTLTERERLVLESIIREGGRISQRKLRHLCDLPKSTLSRVTDELQRKGLVRKIPVGQTNEIRLDEGLLTGSEHASPPK